MDYYAYYRILDALCDYTFNGNLAGKEVALGSGSSSQVQMPVGLTNLEQTDYPTVAIPESDYGFPCSSLANPRNDYCGLLAVSESVNESEILLFPNPVQSILTIQVPNNASWSIEIYTLQGHLVLLQNGTHPITHSIDVSQLQEGIYLCRIKTDNNYFIKKFVKH